MQSIIECLANDEKLTSEIYSEYKQMYFKEHLKPLSASDLPKLTINEKGHVIIDTERQIEKLETQVLDRLTNREKLENNFVYNIDWLHSSLDFKNKIQDLRMTLDAVPYLNWLKDMEINK